MSLICPVCGLEKEQLVKLFAQDLDQPLVQGIHQYESSWQIGQGICTSCTDRLQTQLYRNQASWLDRYMSLIDFTVLPLPWKLNASTQYTGKGVTICFIDSGFYPHPDLTQPENRILAVVDLTDPPLTAKTFYTPQPVSWHGTMTSVVGAGNGQSTEGLYKSLAPDAKVILLKVAEESGRITGDSIVKALDWAIWHREQFNIQIINLSVTDDFPLPLEESEVAQRCEAAVASGINVVAAVGNNPYAKIKPPASAPSVIAVGGLNDRNTLDPLDNVLYHSTYGETLDEFFKPELIAPAIWLPAPILPGTDAYLEAKILFDLLETPDGQLKDKLQKQIKLTRFDLNLLYRNENEIRHIVKDRIRNQNFLNPYFKSVDGTSFAAPIVCSIIAQILEANPSLQPLAVREILFTTARKLQYEPSLRQGYGVIQARSAIIRASGEYHSGLISFSPFINYLEKTVSFQYHGHNVGSVSLAGSFNGWNPTLAPMHQTSEGIWQITIPMPPPGNHTYKFVTDGVNWLTDPRNLYREPNEYNDFNSRFTILS